MSTSGSKVDLPPALRVILIGGTSHAGKSSLARYLAGAIGWRYQTTDKLARHPGRPWSNDAVPVPQHVAAHYATLPVDELLADVLLHYEKNVLPQVSALVGECVSNPSLDGLVLEGSALLPAGVAPLLSEHVGGVWLRANDQLLVARIRAESRYRQRGTEDQLLIDKFIERTLVFERHIERAIEEYELPRLPVSESDTCEMLAERCMRTISGRRHLA